MVNTDKMEWGQNTELQYHCLEFNDSKGEKVTFKGYDEATFEKFSDVRKAACILFGAVTEVEVQTKDGNKEKYFLIKSDKFKETIADKCPPGMDTAKALETISNKQITKTPQEKSKVMRFLTALFGQWKPSAKVQSDVLKAVNDGKSVSESDAKATGITNPQQAQDMVNAALKEADDPATGAAKRPQIETKKKADIERRASTSDLQRAAKPERRASLPGIREQEKLPGMERQKAPAAPLRPTVGHPAPPAARQPTPPQASPPRAQTPPPAAPPRPASPAPTARQPSPTQAPFPRAQTPPPPPPAPPPSFASVHSGPTLPSGSMPPLPQTPRPASPPQASPPKATAPAASAQPSASQELLGEIKELKFKALEARQRISELRGTHNEILGKVLGETEGKNARVLLGKIMGDEKGREFRLTGKGASLNKSAVEGVVSQLRDNDLKTMKDLIAQAKKE